MAQYAYLGGTGTTQVKATGGFVRRLIVGSVPGAPYSAGVGIYDSATAGEQQVIGLSLGAAAGSLGPGVYEVDAEFSTAITVEVSNAAAALTVIYE